MLERLRNMEAGLIRLETRVMVALVLLMLGLASYNVLYRNLLVPLQKHWATSGPVPELPAEPAPVPVPNAPDAPDEPAGGDGAGGFGGGFGDDAPTKAEPAAGDDAGGFGGGFDDAPTKAEPAPADGAGGFGGGFDDAPAARGGGDDAGGFGGGFGEPEADTDPAVDAAAAAELDALVADQDAGAPPDTVSVEPVGGPPPEGSFAASGVAFIDAIKLDWIDIFLRQLVILVSFFGAALATRRRKHINIDAVSKALPTQARRGVAVAVNVLSLLICFVLASAGWDLVDLGLEYPKELVPWAEEWVFQLMFPGGFGLLSLHFIVRLLESVDAFRNGEDAA